MAIQHDAQDYYYNVTANYGCWGNDSSYYDRFYQPYNSYMLNNAIQIRNDLKYYDSGWTDNAICAVLGNMCYESSLNPAQSEIGKPLDGTYGYGLVQWTPRTGYETWANNHNYPITGGLYQVQCLNSEGVPKWQSKSPFNMTWSEFKHSTANVSYLTEAFRACFEGGKQNSYRQYCAEWYANYFGVQTGNQIFVYVTGNGTAFVSNRNPENGEDFVLTCIPASGESLVTPDGITAYNEWGNPIAVTQNLIETYTYNQSGWGSTVSFYVNFTGIQPEPPIPPTPLLNRLRDKMPVWMYPTLRIRRY